MSFMFEITLVCYDNHGIIISILYSQDLLLKGGNFLKGRTRCYAIDKEETFAGTHVLFAHGRIFFLTSCIEDVEEGDFIVDDTLLAI